MYDSYAELPPEYRAEFTEEDVSVGTEEARLFVYKDIPPLQ